MAFSALVTADDGVRVCIASKISVIATVGASKLDGEFVHRAPPTVH